MGCYSKYELRQLRERRQRRELDKVRLNNYKPLYLAARAARDYLKSTSADSAALVAQLDTALIDPHVNEPQSSSPSARTVN